jgi:hypothetical protein
MSGMVPLVLTAWSPMVVEEENLYGVRVFVKARACRCWMSANIVWWSEIVLGSRVRFGDNVGLGM